jgi:hypothetical protein
MFAAVAIQQELSPAMGQVLSASGGGFIFMYGGQKTRAVAMNTTAQTRTRRIQAFQFSFFIICLLPTADWYCLVRRFSGS